MALYRLNESYSTSSAEVLLEQFESFVYMKICKLKKEV